MTVHMREKSVSLALSFSYWSEQGARKHQEDRIIIQSYTDRLLRHGIGLLLAVADGHSGDQTSEAVKRYLEEGLFHTALQAHYGNIPDALQTTVDWLQTAAETHVDSGTTLSLVYLPQDQCRAYVAVIGDSPVVHVPATGRVHVSPEHNVRSNKAERDAALTKGGVIQNGYLYEANDDRGLQLSRAIGDWSHPKVLNRDAEVYQWPLQRGEMLVVGSDGLFDPTHDSTEKEVKRMVGLLNKRYTARQLVEDAVRRITMDNASAIVCRFD